MHKPPERIRNRWEKESFYALTEALPNRHTPNKKGIKAALRRMKCALDTGDIDVWSTNKERILMLMRPAQSQARKQETSRLARTDQSAFASAD